MINLKSIELYKKIAEISDTILIGFSLGKDSIASFLTLKQSGVFKKIIPYYMYSIPDLSFINNSISYFENYFETHIYQLPHPSLYRMLNNLVFQSPENCEIIENFNFPNFTHEQLHTEFLKDLKLPQSTFTAIGVRACDSILRRITIEKYGCVNYKKHTFYPIWDWNLQKVKDCLHDNKIKIPVDYELFGRSFDGLDYRFLKPIKQRFPDDYEKILKYFPLAECELFRRECFIKQGIKND